MDASVVATNHLDSSDFLLFVQKSCRALRCWEEEVDDNRPNYCDRCNDEVDPFPRSEASSMDMTQTVCHDSANNVGKPIGAEPNADSEGLILSGVERTADQDEGRIDARSCHQMGERSIPSNEELRTMLLLHRGRNGQP